MNVLLDLDGTLTDPKAGIVACIKYALEKIDHNSPTDLELERWIGPPLQASFAALLGDHDQDRINHVVSLYRERFSVQGMFENAVYPDIREVLQRLRDFRCRLFVVTAKAAVFAEKIVEHFGLGEFFHAVYGSELDGTYADKSDLIARVLRGEALIAEETIMVGDRAHDVLGAKANGISSVGVLWGYGSREELVTAGADLLCEVPEELVKILAPADTTACNRVLLAGRNHS
jgi:phosphoglycolate phosphatase